MHHDAMLAIGVIEPIDPAGIGVKAAGAIAVRRFKSPDWTERYQGLVQLRQLGPEAVAAHAEAVAECVQSRFVWMRQLAFEALAILTPAELALHVGVLAKGLTDTYDEVCWEALSAFKRLDPEVVHRHAAGILRLLDDIDLDMRLAALAVLGKLELPHLALHWNALERKCNDEAEPVRKRASQLVNHLKENAPRIAVTVRTLRQGGYGSLKLVCTNMAGNTILEMPLDPGMTCDILRDHVATRLNTSPMLVKILRNDASATGELDGKVLMSEIANTPESEALGPPVA